jgi:hypothetical protein
MLRLFEWSRTALASVSGYREKWSVAVSPGQFVDRVRVHPAT